MSRLDGAAPPVGFAVQLNARPPVPVRDAGKFRQFHAQAMHRFSTAFPPNRPRSPGKKNLRIPCPTYYI
jgi:hypothetical protein